MTSEPTKLSVTVNDTDSVTALLYLAPKKQRAGITLILGHGAGAGQLHPFMTLFANGLAARGVDVLTFNFIYMEQRRHVPDPKAKLESCYRAVIDAAHKHKNLKANRLAIGGKSMGGRIASQVAAVSSNDRASSNQNNALPEGRARARLSALVFLGYPLHPPGKPDQLRDAHLKNIRVPMLFAQGSRDAFGSPDELAAVIRRDHLPATLYIVEGGDHSLKAPKNLQERVYAEALDEVSRWLRQE